MIIPMNFYAPTDQADIFSAYAINCYDAAIRCAEHPLPAEQVFPTMFNFIAQNGLYLVPAMSFNDYTANQKDLISAYIFHLFNKVPHLAAEFILADHPFTTLRTPSIQLEEASLSTTDKLPSIETAPQAAISPANPPAAVSEEAVTATVNSSPVRGLILPSDNKPAHTSSPAKFNAYDVAQNLLRLEHIKIIGEALYLHNGYYFEHLSPERMRRVIVKDCRNAIASEGKFHLVDEIYRFILSEPEIAEQTQEMDTNLVTFENGVLNLKTGTLHQFSPSFNTYYQLYTWWGNGGPHPHFDQFLHSISQGDQDLERRILEMIGYCLVPDTDGKVFFILVGAKNAGKSLLGKFLNSCLNQEATTSLDITTLGDRFSAANLLGKQLCLTMDLPSAPLNSKTVGLLKSITGGDNITADIKYSPHVTFINRARFVVGTNFPMVIQGDDPAFFDRAISIPFQHSIPRSQQDHHLLDKLNSERAAIVHDAILAYISLRDRNYQFSGNYSAEMLKTQNVPSPTVSIHELMKSFILQSCVPDATGFAFAEDLCLAFQRFAPECSLNQLQFSTPFLEACAALHLYDVKRGPKKRKFTGGNPQANFTGIKLKDI